jgi:hypothetical protein
MEPIRVTLPDGRSVAFPPGTDPEVVKATLASLGGGSPSSENAPSALQPEQVGAKPGALADSFLARGLRGAMVNRLDPAAEMVTRLLPGDFGRRELEKVQTMNAERKRLHDESRARAGDEGFDAAAMVGTGVVDAATFGPMFKNARTAWELAKQSGKVGAISGALSPVEGSADKDGLEYAKATAKNAAVSGVAGSVLGPAAGWALNKSGEGLKMLGQGVAGMTQRALKPTAAQQLTRNPNELEVFLADQAQAVNIDWRKVPDAVRESLRESARRAVTASGELPADAVRNRLVAEAEQLPALTLGQATRNPMQFTREANNPNDELRTLFGAQRNAATTKLQELPNQLGPAQTPHELGANIADALKAQSKDRKKEVSALYDQFNNSRGALQPLQNSQQFAGDALADLQSKMLFEQLPAGFQTLITKLHAGKGEELLNIRQAGDLRKAINANMTQNGPQTSKDAALGVVKTHLDNMLDNPQVRSEAGEEAIKGFRAAVDARKGMGKWEESSKAIADLTSRNPKVANEYVFSRYVLNGPIKDMQGLWKTLPLENQSQAKRAFVNHVTDLAMNKTGSEAVGAAGTASKFLRQFPKEKLELMFPEKGELKSLRNTLEYLRLVSEAPAGSFKNTSNSMVDMKDFLSSAGLNLPVIGPMITGPLRKMRADQEISESMRGGLHVPAEVEAPRAMQRLAGRSPAALSPLAGVAAQSLLAGRERPVTAPSTPEEQE